MGNIFQLVGPHQVVQLALQRVVTAFAGYLVILRGKTFTLGDRITMGGIRGIAELSEDALRALEQR